MRIVDSNYDILNIIDEGILDNYKNDHYILFMKMIHSFLLESDEIHFDFQLNLLNKANYILTRLYETDNSELKKEYYKMRRLFLDNLQRIQDNKKEE